MLEQPLSIVGANGATLLDLQELTIDTTERGQTGYLPGALPCGAVPTGGIERATVAFCCYLRGDRTCLQPAHAHVCVFHFL